MSKGKWTPLKTKLNILKELRNGGNVLCLSIKYGVTTDVVHKLKQNHTNLCKKYKNSTI